MQCISSCPVCLSSPALPFPDPFCKAAEVCFCLLANTHTTCLAMIRYCIAANLLCSVTHSMLDMICQCQQFMVACKLPRKSGGQTKLQEGIRGLCDSGDKMGTSTYSLHATSSFIRGKQLGDILGEGTRGAAPDGRGVAPAGGHAAGHHLWPLPCQCAVQLACLPPPTCTRSLCQTCIEEPMAPHGVGP